MFFILFFINLFLIYVLHGEIKEEPRRTRAEEWVCLKGEREEGQLEVDERERVRVRAKLREQSTSRGTNKSVRGINTVLSQNLMNIWYNKNAVQLKGAQQEI